MNEAILVILEINMTGQDRQKTLHWSIFLVLWDQVSFRKPIKRLNDLKKHYKITGRTLPSLGRTLYLLSHIVKTELEDETC